MFSDEEKKLLEKYVTSSDEDIFAVRGMEGMVGAAYARYSRARGGFREVLLKEFIKAGEIDPKHADELIERILIAFGDDSVGELEGAHLSLENISMLATKEIEERRIGGSPIEQSTRYVFYDMKTPLKLGWESKGGEWEDQWRYLHDEHLLSASYGRLYRQTMDFIFATYASLVEPLKAYYGQLKPLEQAEYDINGDGIKEKYPDLKAEFDQKAFRLTYNADLRTKACDTLRCLLPLCTLTNVGLFGNGRFFQHLISRLWTSDIPEAQKIGDKAFAAMSKVIPQYVRRAKRSEYLAAVREQMFALSKELCGQNLPEIPPRLPYIELLDDKEDMEARLVSAMLFPYTNHSLNKLRQMVSSMNQEQRQKVIKTYIGHRLTRRDRPGRALEEGYPLTFELITNWGVYKDLMRHRINTQQRQLFTAKIGFEMPAELVAAGFEEMARACVKKADQLYDMMGQESPTLAQYSVLHGHFVRWSLGMNDREAMHLLELRSTPQGHPQYRKAAQEMHKLIKQRCPWRAEMMKFVDYNDYYWSRADSEARQRAEERQLEEKLNPGLVKPPDI